MKLPFQSIRWRIQAWHGLILLIAIAAFCFTAYQLAWFVQLRRIDSEIQQSERALVRNLLHPNRESPTTSSPQSSADSKSFEEPNRPLFPEELLPRLKNGFVLLPPEITSTFSGSEPGYSFFSIADAEGKIILQSENAPASLEFLPLPPEGSMNHTFRQNGPFREAARTAPFGLRTIVGRELSPEQNEMQRFAWSLGASGLTLWILGLLGGWWLAGKAIQPIQRISKTATRIAEGNLNELIDTDGGTSELDQLSHVLNHTFERLNAAFERQRQFTADASHELRTPLTILLSETQRMRKPDLKRDTSEYLESFDLCHETCVRMRNLVESLLLLARQDNGSPIKNLTNCDLADHARISIQQLKPLADAKSITFISDLEPTPFIADPNLLIIVLNNLIDNAIQHHDGPGSITVRCGTKDDHLYLSIQDDGPGISDSDLPRIFDRFYRADKSRNSEEGHSGLGLTLVKTIVENMNGQIDVQSTFGQGTLFTLQFPLNSNNAS